jgi:hypothetical protein
MHSTLRKLHDDLCSTITGLSPSALQARPLTRPSSWSILQIAQHLLLTYESTTASIQERLRKDDSVPPSATAKQRIGRFFVLQLGWIPGRREAPADVRPEAFLLTSLTDDHLLSEISTALNTMDSVLADAEKHFGSFRCQAHFALGPMSIADWRRFHLNHGRHHIRQILKIRRMHNN